MICAYWLLNDLCKYMLPILELFHIIIMGKEKSEDVKDCRVGCSLAKIVIMWKSQRSEARQKCVNQFNFKTLPLALCLYLKGTMYTSRKCGE